MDRNPLWKVFLNIVLLLSMLLMISVCYELDKHVAQIDEARDEENEQVIFLVKNYKNIESRA